jgi:hypothetical protein
MNRAFPLPPSKGAGIYLFIVNNHPRDHFEVTAWVLLKYQSLNIGCKSVPSDKFTNPLRLLKDCRMDLWLSLRGNLQAFYNTTPKSELGQLKRKTAFTIATDRRTKKFDQRPTHIVRAWIPPISPNLCNGLPASAAFTISRDSWDYKIYSCVGCFLPPRTLDTCLKKNSFGTLIGRVTSPSLYRMCKLTDGRGFPDGTSSVTCWWDKR